MRLGLLQTLLIDDGIHSSSASVGWRREGEEHTRNNRAGTQATTGADGYREHWQGTTISLRLPKEPPAA